MAFHPNFETSSSLRRAMSHPSSLKTLEKPVVLLLWGGPGGNHRNVALGAPLQGYIPMIPPGASPQEGIRGDVRHHLAHPFKRRGAGFHSAAVAPGVWRRACLSLAAREPT